MVTFFSHFLGYMFGVLLALFGHSSVYANADQYPLTLPGSSNSACISTDGRYVGVNDGLFVLYDTKTQKEIPVGLTPEKKPVTALFCAISSDGKFVVFNAGDGVYLRDVMGSTTERMDVTPSGERADAQPFRDVHISADGRFVLFDSRATNFGPKAISVSPEVFLWDKQTKKISRANLGSNGAPAISSGNAGSMSADGRVIAFPAYGLGSAQIFTRDLVAKVTKPIVGGVSGVNTRVFVSGNGKYVEYMSTDVGANDRNNAYDVYLYDIAASSSQIVSLTDDGLPFPTNSEPDGLSVDGRYALFISSQTLYLRDMLLKRTYQIADKVGFYSSDISADGRFIIVGTTIYTNPALDN